MNVSNRQYIAENNALAVIDNGSAETSRKREEATNVPYDDLPKETRDEVHKLLRRIRKNSHKELGTVVDIGHDLARMKEIVGHGNFQRCIQREFNWAERTATDYMRLASYFRDKAANFSDLDLATARALIAKSTPAEIRDELYKRAEAGQNVSSEEVRGRIAESKTAGREPAAEAKKADFSAAKEVEAEALRGPAIADGSQTASEPAATVAKAKIEVEAKAEAEVETTPARGQSPADDVAEAVLNLMRCVEKHRLACTPSDVALASALEEERIPSNVRERVEFIQKILDEIIGLIPPAPEIVRELELTLAG